jgi:CHASE2 domain-containing sensor protein
MACYQLLVALIFSGHRGRESVQAFLKIFVPALIAPLIGFAVDVTGFFGLDRMSDDKAARVIDVLGAPFYGGRERIGQDHIAVVTMNEETLRRLGAPGLPMSYALQGDIVSTVASYEPAAIFVDFTYRSLHQERSELERYAGRLKAIDARIPLAIGPVRDDLDPNLSPLASVPQRSISFNRVEGDRVYELHDEYGHEKAALFMFKALCARKPEIRSCASLGSLGDSALAIGWGYGSSQFMAAQLPDALRGVCTSTTFLSRVAAFFKLVVRGAFNPEETSDRLSLNCTYHDNVEFGSLLTEEGHAFGQSVLKGRLVFIGVDLDWTRDNLPTPLFGELPGVFAHAMATDNLIENGRAARRDPAQVFLGLDWVDIMEALVVIATTAIICIVSFIWSHKVRLISTVGLILLTALLGVLICYWLTPFPIVNIFSIVAASIVVALQTRFAALKQQAESTASCSATRSY